MKCPVDGNELKIADRQGIEIDFCPQCRGVWLDRGELDKLIERSTGLESQPTSTFPRRENKREFFPDDDQDEYRHSAGEHYRDNDGRHSHGKKKKSFLGDVFDIFG